MKAIMITIVTLFAVSTIYASAAKSASVVETSKVKVHVKAGETQVNTTKDGKKVKTKKTKVSADSDELKVKTGKTTLKVKTKK